MQLFNAPPRIHELAGEPVEQLRMRRFFAARPEVFRRIHEAEAEVSLPGAIHERAGGGRRFAVYQPFGEREPRAVRVWRQRMEE